ncbi:MFS transporter [Fluviispira sanaruensis]|uniref:MFS transporter n=1 Tax=Fluviispira sanaruensis TaxID=2493639 RepID=A0A4P2VNH1_FLUSA|nr:MFS transporter [Fluviispira sanaruensis]BBH53550.1 MFS transporter [Fluviispira sanaruensis]
MENALRFKNYQYFIGGSFFTLLGDYIGFAALNWVIWTHTSSELNLGIINFIRLLPALFIGFLGGALADRYNQKKLLILVYLLIAVFNFALFYIVLNKNINIFLIGLIIGLRGLFVEMEPSVRNSLLPRLIEKEAICSAVSIYTSVLNITAILGPALAGLALAKMDSGFLFLFQFLGQILVIISLFFITGIQEKNQFLSNDKNVNNLNYKSVVLYIKENPDLLCTFIAGCVLMLFLFPYISLMPAFVKASANMGPETYGRFLVIAALGTILGSSLISFLRKKIHALFILSTAVFASISFIILGAVNHILLTYIFLFLIGFFSQISRTANRVYFQIKSPNEIRGKLMSLALSDRGFLPFGALLAGFIAHKLGMPKTFMIFGICSLSLLIILLITYQVKERKVSNEVR